MSDGALAGRRVLVVEDGYFVADELDCVLRAAGAEVLGPVGSVRGALDLLSSDPSPDAAVLDVNLGGEMAYPVADALLARGVPFVFATGYDVFSLPQRYAAVRVLEKPFVPREFLRELNRLLD